MPRKLTKNSASNVFNWKTDTATLAFAANGIFGFTLYDELDNILHQRLPSHAALGDGESIQSSSIIDSITFETNGQKGFYGLVNVTIAGRKQLYTCVDCGQDSPSTNLSRLYLDLVPTDGDRNVAGAANCETTCTFKRGSLTRPNFVS